MSEIRLDREDVTLEELPVDNCTECDELPARYFLQIDLRGAGVTTSSGDGRYCEPCGREQLARISETLPEKEAEWALYLNQK